jgi:hypothetical protein
MVKQPRPLGSGRSAATAIRKTISIKMDPGIHRQLKILAVTHGKTIGELIEKASLDLLKKYQSKK